MHDPLCDEHLVLIESALNLGTVLLLGFTKFEWNILFISINVYENKYVQQAFTGRINLWSQM